VGMSRHRGTVRPRFMNGTDGLHILRVTNSHREQINGDHRAWKLDRGRILPCYKMLSRASEFDGFFGAKF
jgi:hypothetical protein